MQYSLVKRIASHYRREFANPRQERLFISSVSFLSAFGGARAVTHAIQHRIVRFITCRSAAATCITWYSGSAGCSRLAISGWCWSGRRVVPQQPRAPPQHCTALVPL